MALVGLCDLNTNLHINEFCLNLFFVILVKLWIHCRYASGPLKEKTPKKPIRYIGAYFVLAYGIWTLFNILRYVRSPESCFTGSSNINMINYTLLMLLGVFPLTMLVLGLTFGLVLAGMVTR